MTGTLLHNMSVPPRYWLSVRRKPLGGVAFCVGAAKYWYLREFNPASPPPREALEAALARFNVPNRVGVFLAPDGRGQAAALSFLAAAAILSRRSGPLYLPWRPIDPALVVPAGFLLVFPEEGVEQ